MGMYALSGQDRNVVRSSLKRRVVKSVQLCVYLVLVEP